MRERLARELRRPGVCIKVLAAKAGVSLRHVYNMAQGKPASLDATGAVVRELPLESQSRIAAAWGWTIRPIQGLRKSLGEVVARMASWFACHARAMLDGRIDHREQRELEDSAHDVLQSIECWLPREDRR